MQYVIITPREYFLTEAYSSELTAVTTVIAIVGVICEKYQVLCEDGGFDPSFAYVYLESVSFVSIS